MNNQKEITQEKAYVLGVLCGDGYLSLSKNSSYEIGLRTIDGDFAEEFLKCVKIFFNVILKKEYIKSGITRIRDKTYKTKMAIRVRKCSKKIYLDLSQYGNFSTTKWKVPEEIIETKNEKIICSFLKGFIDSEGTIREYCMEITSSNKMGLDQMKELLLKIGIKRISFYKDWKSVWKLIFSGKDNLLVFYEKVGFSIKRKQAKLESAIQYKFASTTKEYLNVLDLRKMGYDYIQISKMTGINKWKVESWYKGESIPHQFRRDIKLGRFPENWLGLCNSFPFLKNIKA